MGEEEEAGADGSGEGWGVDGKKCGEDGDAGEGVGEGECVAGAWGR